MRLKIFENEKIVPEELEHYCNFLVANGMDNANDFQPHVYNFDVRRQVPLNWISLDKEDI